MAAPNGFAGNIASGSGASYVINIVGGVPPTVSATCLNIDSGEDVPNGTGVILVKIGSTYYFTVPLWADD